MILEETDQWGIPFKPKKPVIKKKQDIEEESCFFLEDLHLTLRYLTEVVEPDKFEITSTEDDRKGTWSIVVSVHVGNLSSLVSHANVMMDKEEMDFLEAITELLDIHKIESDIENSLWSAVRRQGSFTGISVEIVNYPRSPEELKNASFEFEIELGYEKPSKVDLDKTLRDVLKSSMKWWV